jgi:fructokinase
MEAVVVGEALVDLMETDISGERAYRPMVGGAPLNVAVGLARLGRPVEFVGSIGRDVLGQRIRAFLAGAGVGTSGCVEVDVPTSLAVTSFDGAEPDFHFYGEPPSYGLLPPASIDLARVRASRALYCGSIALLCEPSLTAARLAWAEPGPIKAFDPNVRLNLVRDVGSLRTIVEEFAATADLVKLSEPDARALFDTDPDAAADHLRSVGARTVVVTRGAAGALVVTGTGRATVPAPPVHAVDTTGAGDATMAGLMSGLMDGVPSDLDGWLAVARFAVTVAALVCERPGGATAMPTLPDVLARVPDA